MTFPPRRVYRVLAIAEAVTWTLLLAGMLLKYVVRVGDWPVSIAGPIHGFVFLAYAAMALLVAINQRWALGVGGLAVASAVVPYATIPVHAWLARSGRLDGGWRVDATDDPRDRNPVDRLVRVLLRRPLLLVALLAAAVAALFVVLLIVGPPGR